MAGLLFLVGCAKPSPLEEMRLCADIGIRYYTHACPHGADERGCGLRPYFQIAEPGAPHGARSCVMTFEDVPDVPKVRLFDLPPA
jgi:hypothetical protein